MAEGMSADGVRGPDFFIVGAPKAGTTALAESLRAHPQVFMPVIKEPNHFCTDLDFGALPATMHDRLPLSEKALADMPASASVQSAWVPDRTQYLRLFQQGAGSPAAGEGSTSYLYSREAARRIHEFAPQARIIAVLRDPVARAWSHYLMDMRIGIAAGSFREAIQAELEGTAEWTSSRMYLGFGRYGEQLSRYYECFAPSQILVLRQDALAGQPQAVLNRVCAFLEIDAPDDQSGLTRVNTARATRFPALNRFLHVTGLRRYLRAVMPRSVKSMLGGVWFREAGAERMDEALRTELQQWFAPDLLVAQRLSGVDLSDWLGAAPSGSADKAAAGQASGEP